MPWTACNRSLLMAPSPTCWVGAGNVFKANAQAVVSAERVGDVHNVPMADGTQQVIRAALASRVMTSYQSCIGV
jgi:hypothetical protein